MVLSVLHFSLTRIVTFALAALVSASAAYWAMQLSNLQGDVSVAAVQAESSLVALDSNAVARALGGGAGQIGVQGSTVGSAPAAGRFTLAGVVATSTGSQSGAALIAVDGAAAKPFTVGARIGAEWVLRSVQARQAVLVRPSGADGQATTGDPELVLEMPKLPTVAGTSGTPG